GLHPNGVVLPILRHIPWMARRCPYRKRHFFQRLVWQPAEDHLATTKYRPNPDVRRQQRRRCDGQDGRRTIDLRSYCRHQHAGNRGLDFPKSLLALCSVGIDRWNYRDAIRLRVPERNTAWADVYQVNTSPTLRKQPEGWDFTAYTTRVFTTTHALWPLSS